MNEELLAMLTSKCHMNITYIFCLVALVMQVLSLIVPGWLIVTFPGNETTETSLTENHAVLYITLCTNYNNMTSVCVFESYSEQKNKRFEFEEVFNESLIQDMGMTFTTVLEWEMEIVFGFIALVVSLFLLYRLRTFNRMALASTAPGIKEPSVMMYVVNIASMWISYILYLIAIQWIVQVTMSLNKKASSYDLTINTPFGLIIAVLGTLLTFCSLFSLFTVLLCPCVRREAITVRQCQSQAMELVPIQSNAVTQPVCDNSLPPPYVDQNEPGDGGNQQEMDPKQGYANSLLQDESLTVRLIDKPTRNEN